MNTPALTATRGIVLALALTFTGPMLAEAAYPEHPITGIIPFDPGGASDVVSRIVAAALSRELNQPIIMENKPGGAANLGIGLVAHGKPDGYTLLFCAMATTQNPTIFKKIPYDPMKDLIPIAIFGKSPMMVAVNTDKIPAKTFQEFVDIVRKNPGKYNLAAGGGGKRMSDELLMVQNNLKVELLTYKGDGEAATALIGGEADFTLGDGVTMTNVSHAKNIRMLVVAGDARSPQYPDVPTTAEAGNPGYIDQNFLGLYAPGGTPMEIVQKLNAAANKVLADPDVKERFAKLGFSASPMSQPAFVDYYKSEIAKWHNVAEKANIAPID